MLSFNVPVKVKVSFALLPPGIVSSKLTLVVCASSSWETVGDSEMTCSPAVTLVEWILSSFVFRDIEVVSSTTSKLVGRQQTIPHNTHEYARNYILNDDGTLVGELVKVWLEGQVIVEGLDIGRQNLAAFGDVNG